jgi:hypothetical protein
MENIGLIIFLGVVIIAVISAFIMVVKKDKKF